MDRGSTSDAGAVAALTQGSSAVERRAPWLRWTAALALADLLPIVANANALVAYLEARGRSYPLEPPELIWIHVTTIVLGLLVATPLIALTIWLGRRTSLPLGSFPFALSLGIFAFLVTSRIDTFAADLVSSWVVDPSFDLTSIIVSPAIEESMKAVTVLAFALLVRRWSGFGVREGIVAGVLIGLGANAVEAGVYTQLDYAAGHGAIYGTVIALRFGAFGFGLHVATSALFGAAIGAVLTRSSRRRGTILLATFIAAIASHGVWNVAMSRLVSEVIANIAPPPDFSMNEPVSQPSIWIASTVVDLLFLAPILVVLVIAWRRSPPTKPSANPKPVPAS